MIWTIQQRSEFGQLAAIRSRNGSTVVLFLHGVGLRAEAWNAQLEVFADQHTVIAPDMPGHGESTPFFVTPNLERYTARVAEALDTKAIVVGHSMGAMIALDLAVRYPHLVCGLVALNAIYRRRAQAREAVLTRASELDGVSVPDPSAPLSRWFGLTPSPEADACGSWLRGCDPSGYRAAYSVFAQGDAPANDALAALDCPALFMTGAEDPNSTPNMSEAMAAIAPNGKSISVAGAAHMLPMTHPTLLNEALKTFINECANDKD